MVFYGGTRKLGQKLKFQKSQGLFPNNIYVDLGNSNYQGFWIICTCSNALL